MERVMAPVPQSPNTDRPPYEYQAWPAWRYTEDDKGERKGAIFDRVEDVPDGWLTLDEYNAKHSDGEVAPPKAELKDPGETLGEGEATAEDALTEEQRAEAIDALVKANDHSELVDMVLALPGPVEFSERWGKPKLAALIVDNGGPVAEAGE